MGGGRAQITDLLWDPDESNGLSESCMYVTHTQSGKRVRGSKIPKPLQVFQVQNLSRSTLLSTSSSYYLFLRSLICKKDF